MDRHSGSPRRYRRNQALFIYRCDRRIRRGIGKRIYAFHPLHLKREGVARRFQGNIGMAGAYLLLIFFCIILIRAVCRLFVLAVVRFVLFLVSSILALLVRDLRLRCFILCVICLAVLRLLHFVLAHIILVAAIIAAALASRHRKQHGQCQQKHHQFFHAIISSRIIFPSSSAITDPGIRRPHPG